MNLLKTRRRFLKSVLGAGAMAPLSMTGMANLAMASGDSKLKVIFMVIPDGFGVDARYGHSNGIWFPKGTSGARGDANGNGGAEVGVNNLNEMAKGLNNYRGNFNGDPGIAPYVKDALFLQNFMIGQGNGGHNGWVHALRDNKGSKTSIDNILGETLKGTNPTLKRINSGPHATHGAQWNVSWQDNNKQIPYTSPYSLFDLVYNGVPESGGGAVEVETNLPSRSRFLAQVEDQLLGLKNDLGNVLGTQERAKLNDHLDAVNELSTDLDASLMSTTTTQNSAGCSPSAANPNNHGSGLAINSAQTRNEITSAHIDIVAGGLSCGLSRVATLQLGRSADQIAMPEISGRSPHDCAHAYGSEAEWLGSRQWYVTQLKLLLDKLSELPDPDKPGTSLYDNTLVVFTSEMADGAPEHMIDTPVTLFGAKDMLNTGTNANKGRYLDLYAQGDQSHWKLGKVTGMQRMWATIAQAAGTSVPYADSVTPLKGVFNNV